MANNSLKADGPDGPRPSLERYTGQILFEEKSRE